MIYVECLKDCFRNKTQLTTKGKDYKLLDYNYTEVLIDCVGGGQTFSTKQFNEIFRFKE